ncbi:type IV pilus biogenesis protein PilM [Pseudomonas psychrophila]|uniref:Type IV pilus assembly protein PilM n=1 Tax=Pseudomonas psychrophila TaxID=122355 RepID=A0ABY0VDR3_9PSED|nr:type IV pilus assembly protein PilM [Pseudomonas psychrophila]KAB0487071.1 type IV pilus assembly protein PilM [Pseudomonas psychrophila]KMM97405.1 pilus assembly protein PilM [Pseudomonas psychrophila]QIE30960.1 type IV pilus assembly protein PilM [Pseudomonas psychrophila]WVI97503.1 type IV pilus assembly protein PilM [Pseudomonas psychrophila]SDU11539.1 type IV pilus assembly protein PilM [Pseudomonas psychrophila]
MPGFLPTTRHRFIGVDISQQAIKVVELSRSRGKFMLQGYAIEPLPAGLTGHQTGAESKSVVQALQRALEKAAVVTSNAIVGIPDGQVICKTLEVEAGLNEIELELHVRLEAEQHIPYALEDVALDFEVQGFSSSHPGRINVQVAACRQEALEWHRCVLTSAGLTPRVVTVQAHALARGVEAMAPNVALQDAVAVLDLAPRAIFLSVVCHGQVIYSRELRLEPEAAEQHGFENTISGHLERELELFAQSGIEETIAMIILAGEAATTPGLRQCIETRLGTPTRTANPFSTMSLEPALAPEALLCDAPVLLTACGLALRGFD